MKLLTTGTEHFETIADFLRFGLSKANAHELYYGHGADNAWDDILTLVLGTLSLPHNMNSVLLSARLTEEEKQRLREQLQKRIIHKIPVPYLLNSAPFCGLSFYVDERVLIPRSPIAELIEAQFSPWIQADSVARVLDLCTGSACIAIACCYAFPDAAVDAVELSEAALEVAKINQQRHHVEEQLTLIHSDCWQRVPSMRYDIIVSNPPYVGDEEMDTLPEEYRHEPDMALRAPDNGLEIVEKILRKAHHYLSDHGILVVEVGNSEEALAEAYPQVPFTWLDFEHGGQGIFLLTKEQLQTHFS